MYQTQLFPSTISTIANDQLINQLQGVIDPSLSVDDNFNRIRFQAGKSGRADLMISIKLRQRQGGRVDRNLYQITVLADEVPVIAFVQTIALA